MSTTEMICGRDAEIKIDGKAVLQAEKIEIRRSCELHAVRSVFVSEDIAHIRQKPCYKANLTGVRFRKPFENLCFADLDNFTLSAEIDGSIITLTGCMWDDFLAAADRTKFREHISVTALGMETEDEE